MTSPPTGPNRIAVLPVVREQPVPGVALPGLGAGCALFISAESQRRNSGESAVRIEPTPSSSPVRAAAGDGI